MSETEIMNFCLVIAKKQAIMLALFCIEIFFNCRNYSASPLLKKNLYDFFKKE